VIVFLQVILRLLADLVGLIALSIRPRRSIEAENLFLRRQLALYKERGLKPERVDAATRVSLALLARLFDWRDALVVVRPETLIRWRRAGWRLFWRCKSRPGRPPIPLELRQLIRRMAMENRLWGEERIANELLLKLGLRVSPRTVRKYMPKRPPGRPRGDQRWSTFLRNHAKAIVACDFFVAVTATYLKCRKPKDYMDNPQTLGEHIRKRRRELGLTLKEAGRILGVTDYTVINWEHHRTGPDRPSSTLRRFSSFSGTTHSTNRQT
jgi:DNA-binding XRE family transcriptional regulator